MAISMAVKDALLRRAGVIKVYWDKRTEVTYEQKSQVPMQMLPELLAPGQNETIDVMEGDLDEMTGTVSGLIRRNRETSKPRIDPVPLDEFLLSANVASPNLDEARFRCHQRPMTKSELIELGLDRQRVEDLEIYDTVDTSKSGVRARSEHDRELRTGHESTAYVLVCESYYDVDFDGDGIAELRRVITAGGSDGADELLLNEPWDDQPFCLGVPYLGIYSWDGVSLFDKLKAVQDVKTDMIRELRNATIRNMRQRVGAVEGDANADDVMTSVMGGLVRCRTSNGVFALPDIPVPQGTYGFLEYLDTMRKDKGGGAIDSAAQVNALAGDTAHGLERMMSAAEQVNAMVAKNLCETLVKSLYRKLHKLMRQYQQDPIMLPGSAGWTSTAPAQWSPREDMVISMGMSVGERTRRTAALMQIQQTQQQDMENGQAGILTDLNAMYQTRIDIARMAGLPNPEQYFLDPASPEAQQAAQANQQQQQQQEAQAEQQKQETMQFQYGLMTDIERVKNEGRLQQQQMQNAVAQLQASIDMFGQRVKLAEVEQKGDVATAQVAIDAMQAEAGQKNNGGAGQ